MGPRRPVPVRRAAAWRPCRWGVDSPPISTVSATVSTVWSLSRFVPSSGPAHGVEKAAGPQRVLGEAGSHAGVGGGVGVEAVVEVADLRIR